MAEAAHTLFITQELLPYHATGGMGVLSRDLPQALGRQGWPHSWLLPWIEGVTALPSSAHRRTVVERTLAIDGADYPYTVFAVPAQGTPGEVFFVSQEAIFGGRIYDDAHRLHRNLIMGDAALAILGLAGPRYGQVHALDQLSALSLGYVRVAAGRRYGLIFNILSAEYDFALGEQIERASFARRAAMHQAFGPSLGSLSAIEVGMQAADHTVTSSPAYADSLAQRYGLHGRAERARLTGIAQGIDTRVWDPGATDRLFRPIHPDRVEEDKQVNRARLAALLAGQPRFSDCAPSLDLPDLLTPDPNAPPLLCFVGRFCRAKGRAALYALLDSLDAFPEVELLFLIPAGSVTAVDLQKLRHRAESLPGLRVINAYDQAFAELVFAASDYVLMPSEQEPGGLCQKMAMRFGALPLVTPAGGLKSSVIDAMAQPGQGTGFVADGIEPDSYLAMLRQVLARARNDPLLCAARRQAMATDQSWAPTIGAYQAVYEALAARGLTG